MSIEQLMKSHPILFSAPMVRALLDGRKTQTRRIIKFQPDDDAKITTSRGVAYIGNSTSGGHVTRVTCPYGQSNDLLWVRETFQIGHYIDGSGEDYSLICPTGSGDRDGRLFYRADLADGSTYGPPRWRSPIHMPRWASRITLRLTDVRVERLQDISEGDAKSEGITDSWPEIECNSDLPFADGYRWLWGQINGAESWATNPFVWALTFERVLPP